MKSPSLEAILWGLGISTTLEVAYLLATWWRRRRDAAAVKIGANEKRKNLSVVLFFPDRTITRRTRREAVTESGDKENGTSGSAALSGGYDITASGAGQGGFARLVEELRGASKTLDVCVFCFTSRHLREVLVEKHRQGVVVRVIGDRTKGAEDESQTHKLRPEGIEVRENDGSFFMHHKFAVIDGSILINGSFNWSHNAITGNNENVILTSASELVRPYTDKFEELWKQCDPRIEFST